MKAQAMNIIKMLSKPTTERMPFEGVELTKFLQRIPFFKRMFHTQSEKFISLCLSATLTKFQPLVNIYQEEESPNSIYILLEGSVRVESIQTKIKRTVQAFDLIGNVEVVFRMDERAETAITEEEVTCMVLNAESLLNVLKQKQEILKAFRYLQINSYFQGLSGYDKKSLTLLMKKDHFQKGQTIVYEGQFNKKVFFLIHGRINVSRKISIQGEEKQILVDTIEEMDSYGEYESINKCKSQVRITGTSMGSYYSIDMDEVREKKNLFMEMVERNAFAYPDKEQLEFRYKIQALVQEEKQKIVKKLKIH